MLRLKSWPPRTFDRVSQLQRDQRSCPIGHCMSLRTLSPISRTARARPICPS
ncbi:hypothetical protein BDZ91DRAFT_714795 [Kalaharituber pfeilii]|nr:hypothetical protein BDZ91DRAFT_714795 [Kalaharituber pfeilii]